MPSELRITVLSGTSAGDVFRFQVESGGHIVIGRAAECNLVLQDPQVSRRHLKMSLAPEGFSIVDLGSSHGTVHMGFHLKAGDEGARVLSDGDEFKIGELLFRVEFDDTPFRKNSSVAASKGEALETAPKKSLVPASFQPWLRGRKALLLGAIVTLLVVLLLLPSGSNQGPPPQRSTEVLSIPSFRVIGYLPGRRGARAEERDSAHFDKAQFDIPASDILVEYEVLSGSPIAIKVDDIQVDEIAPTEGAWTKRQLIVRGMALGKERRLVFDNLAPGKPSPGGMVPQSNSAQWAVRDVRAAPLSSTFGVDGGFLPHLTTAMGLVSGIDKTQAGLFTLVRALQVSAVELLKEQKIDAVSAIVNVGGENAVRVDNIADIQQRLESIRRSYEQSSSSVEQSMKDLTALMRVTGDLDAELWRRLISRMNQAQIESKVKRHINAHDLLVSAQEMFPGGADYRWTLANRLLMNDKIVPKRVRENPHDFRK